MAISDFLAIWNTFIGELDARHRRLCTEIESSWRNLDELLQKHAQNLTLEEWQTIPRGSLVSILDITGTRGSKILFEPLLALRKAALHERVLSAIEDYQTDIEGVLRLLPQSVTISQGDLAKHLAWKGKRLRRFFPGWEHKARSISMRATLLQVLLEHSLARAKLDSRLLMLLVRATLALLIPWQFLRFEALRTLEDNRYSPRDLSQDREEWLRLMSDLRKAAARILDGYGTWRQNLPRLIAPALFDGEKRFSERRRDRARDRWQSHFGFWSRQQRAIVAHLELEFSAGRLLEASAKISTDSLASLDEEHTQLLSELDKVSTWLETWRAEEMANPFPPPEARLIPAEDRAAEWNHRIEIAGRAALPVHVEFMETERIFPGYRRQSRSLETEACFVKSLAGFGQAIALSGFREAEEGHRTIIREIERAREVAAYSIETGDIDSEEDRQVARDGISNALSLLTYQKKSATDYHPVVERRLVEALSSTFLQFYLTLEKGRLGLFKHHARQKGRRAVRTGAAAALARVKAGTSLARDRISSFNRYILIRLGWSPPPTTAVEAVIRREYLGEALNLKARPRELPAIYKRLFRLAPVEDQRFLVGRDAEMAAASEARQLWEEGRSVAILVAGARGSGKTSFLNCAQSAIFGDLRVINGHFSNRITTGQDLRSFLSSFVQTDVNSLDSYLKSDKRLIILEEVERTFIRRIGGFEGLRALLNLISATSRNTLWILSLNETALRYLAKIVQMEEYFSHKINAMAVTPRHLRSAILMRHNLSGLRLQFAEPRSADTRVGKVQRLFGLEKRPDQIFFELLYRQSEGIFRSAFELWQKSVDRVEGGVLYMLTPAEPDFEGMISQLTLEDSFILQAILQHGSLTPEEISLIFDYAPEKSLRLLERLIACEILEADPNNPGFRVRPEAGGIVRDALYRQNLV